MAMAPQNTHCNLNTITKTMSSESGLSPTSSSPPNPSDTHIHPLDPLAPPFLPTNPIHQTFNTASATRRSMNTETPPSNSESSSPGRTSICQLNCRGLLSKFLDIEQLILNEWQSQVVCLCETWLHSCSTTDSFLSIDGYTLFRRDRPHNHHGGLLVYVNPNLRPRRRPDLEHTDIECITLELHARSFGTFLFFCYCPPNFPPLTFFPLLSERLEQATNFPTFLLGDFNAKHPLWNTGPSNTAGTHFRNV